VVAVRAARSRRRAEGKLDNTGSDHRGLPHVGHRDTVAGRGIGAADRVFDNTHRPDHKGNSQPVTHSDHQPTDQYATEYEPADSTAECAVGDRSGSGDHQLLRVDANPP
jgi:hypothetical protein